MAKPFISLTLKPGPKIEEDVIPKLRSRTGAELEETIEELVAITNDVRTDTEDAFAGCKSVSLIMA